METAGNTFLVEDAFYITSRAALVLVGEVTGQVSSGNKLLFSNGICWLVKSVEAINFRNQQEKIGLIVDAPVVSQQEILDSIIGDRAQLLAP